MTRIDGLTLTEAEHAIEAAHPGWHVWHSRDGHQVGSIYATTTVPGAPDGSGTTLAAPSVERIEQVIGQWEHSHAAARARVTMHDDSLPHQIRLLFTSNPDRTRTGYIGVFCSCRPGLPLAAPRPRWDDPDEPMRIWRRHAEEAVA